MAAGRHHEPGGRWSCAAAPGAGGAAVEAGRAARPGAAGRGGAAPAGLRRRPGRVRGPWAAAESGLAGRIAAARRLLPDVVLPDGALRQVASVCAAFGVDGLRADLVTARAAMAHAAWAGRTVVSADDIRAAARLALPHRRRRQPYPVVPGQGGSGSRWWNSPAAGRCWGARAPRSPRHSRAPVERDRNRGLRAGHQVTFDRRGLHRRS